MQCESCSDGVSMWGLWQRGREGGSDGEKGKVRLVKATLMRDLACSDFEGA